jgi:uncharacterized protein (TIGR02145 family)
MRFAARIFVTAILANGCMPDSPDRDFPAITGIVTDIDGNRYITVKIGDCWWMAENLKTTRYRNGDPITEIQGSDVWAELSAGGTCYYGNDTAHLRVFGRLYNGFAVEDNRHIAPLGWHIPTREEWEELILYLGGESLAGGKLKAAGTGHWAFPNTGATNETGFSAFAGGYRNGSSGAFSGMGKTGKWWAARGTGGSDTTLIYRELNYDQSAIAEGNGSPGDGYAVRCVKD